MRIEFLDDPELFAARAWMLLTADQANHTIILSVLQGARRAATGAPAVDDRWSSAVVERDGRIVAAACRSRDNWLLSTGPADALRAFGAALRTQPAFAALVGSEPSVRACEAGYGAPARTHVVLPLLRLARAPDAGTLAPVGRLLRVTEEHSAIVLEWSYAFHDEAKLADPRERVPQDVAHRVALGSLHLWLDQDSQPVCLVGGSLIEPSGARIGPVYTPPRHRGRGFGRAAVTSLARDLLARGAHEVFLFTDAENPTSNALYVRIGFAPIGTHLHLLIDRRAR